MLDDYLTSALNEQSIPSEFRPDPALQVPWGDPVAVAIVANGGVEVASTGFLVQQEDLQFRLAMACTDRSQG